MKIGGTYNNYTAHRTTDKMRTEEREFRSVLKRKSEEVAKPINKSCSSGRWTLVNTGYQSGKIVSITYAEESTNSDPIMMTSDGENRIHINNIDPSNATGLEMQMFCSYLDATGRGTGGTFGTYNDLRSARLAAHYEEGGTLNSFVPTEEQLKSTLYNWTEMAKKYMYAVKPNDPKQYERIRILYDALENKEFK